SRPHRSLHSFPTRRSSDLLDVCPILADFSQLQALPPSIARKHKTGFFSRLDHWKLRARRGRAFVAPLQHPPLSRRRFDYRGGFRSEEHTSELQSRENLVCR